MRRLIKNRKIPTIIAIIVLIFGVAVGVLLVSRQQVFRLGAYDDRILPQDVRFTNISDTKVTVSWVTREPTIGFVEFGTSSNQLTRQATESETSTSTVHWITVEGLTAQTDYYFQIISDGTKFNNNSAFWKTKTASSLTPKQFSPTDTIQGTITTAQGSPVSKALVFITIPGVQELSAVTSDSTWSVTTTTARVSTSLASYAQIASSDIVNIFVQAGSEGIASAKINFAAAGDTPPIQIGQTHDFRTATVPTTTPSAPSIPDTTTIEDVLETTISPTPSSTPSSGRGFSVPEPSDQSTSSTEVQIESIEEGEILTTTKPQFFGSAPAGTEIQITVESENPVSDELSVSSTGNWAWTPPQDLAPGNHVVTISWRDANGILQQIRKSFVVQAAEGPAFTSTPSATPRPSTSPTATPTSTLLTTSITPTATTTPTKKPTPTPTSARTTIPSTESGIPVAGSLTPTLLLTMMGLGLISFGLFAWKTKAFSDS